MSKESHREAVLHAKPILIEIINENKNLQSQLTQVNEQLKECREHLVNAVSKECKCENISSINDSFVKHNRGLKAQTKEASEAIESLLTSMERARAYQEKYKDKK